MTTKLEGAIYTAHATVTGGRDGHGASDDGQLDVDLRHPEAMGGPGGATNPEQLFAVGYGACFQGALAVVGRRAKVDISQSVVTAEVQIGPTGPAYGLAVVLDVLIPGVDEATATELVEAAHEVCPYSNAVRGNIEVELRARVA